MTSEGPATSQQQGADPESARLAALGYRQELSRVLGRFANFSVAFTYLSPMVGIYSLFVFGVGAGGPRYLWLMPIVVIGMLFVAMVFGELGSHYPVAGALYQYSKYTVGPSYGWWVGWFYGVALLVTVAAVDTGIVPYVSQLSNNWFNTSLDPTSHSTILLITLGLLAIQTTLNIIGAKVMGRVAEFGTYVEILGTFGIALILAIAGFHHGFGFLFTTQGAEHASTNPMDVNFHGSWLTGAALVAILAHVYIFYGFESAGDVAEETKDASRTVPRAMRNALVVGGITSFVLVAALLLAIPSGHANYDKAASTAGGVPFILSSNISQSWLNDLLLLLVCFAFFSCGSSVQGAGARLAFSYARDGAVPGGRTLSHVSPRFRTPVYALLLGALIPAAFALLVNITPSENKSFLFITYPAKVSALTALVSFGVSGIYLSFLLTVIGAIVARARGWVPEGPFQLRQWAWPVTIAAAVYLGAMLLNVVWPSGLNSPRAVLFNLDWVTVTVMFLIAVVGLVVFLIAQPAKAITRHVHDELEATGAERHGEQV
ncbi:MAG: APC family permease [Actinomycetes bacterium]